MIISFSFFSEIGRLDAGDLSRDTSGSRALGLFLVETAERVPAAVLPSISVLLPHLDGEVRYLWSLSYQCSQLDYLLQEDSFLSQTSLVHLE